jgi:hypothetical protein
MSWNNQWTSNRQIMHTFSSQLCMNRKNGLEADDITYIERIIVLLDLERNKIFILLRSLSLL